MAKVSLAILIVAFLFAIIGSTWLFIRTFIRSKNFRYTLVFLCLLIFAGRWILSPARIPLSKTVHDAPGTIELSIPENWTATSDGEGHIAITTPRKRLSLEINRELKRDRITTAGLPPYSFENLRRFDENHREVTGLDIDGYRSKEIFTKGYTETGAIGGYSWEYTDTLLATPIAIYAMQSRHEIGLFGRSQRSLIHKVFMSFRILDHDRELTLTRRADHIVVPYREDNAVPVNLGDRSNQIVATGDLNGDQLADLVAIRSGVRIMLNTGNPDPFRDSGLMQVSLKTPYDRRSLSLRLIDLNGDGNTDTFVGSSNLALINYGDPRNLAVPVPISLPEKLTNFRKARFGDVNQDGRADLLLVSQSRELRLFLNDESGVWESAGEGMMLVDSYSSASDAALCDLNADGLLDLVVRRSRHEGLAILLNTGRDPVYDTEAFISFGDNSRAAGRLTGADLNGDGFIDLLYASVDHVDASGPSLSIVYATASPDWDAGVEALTLPVRLPQYPEKGAIHVGDADGDGDVDMFVSGRYIENGGTPIPFQQARYALIEPDHGVKILGVADFNGDGRADLLVESQFDNGVRRLNHKIFWSQP